MTRTVWEVAQVGTRVAREQGVVAYRRVGADEEVGQRRSAGPTGTPVADERLPGEEGGIPRQVLPPDLRGQGLLEYLDLVEADADLRVDHRIDGQVRVLRGVCERVRRPCSPFGISSEDVEEHIAVDEDRAHSSSPRVSAMISSVVRRVWARPRMRATSARPRVGSSLTFARRTTPLSSTKCTSVPGRKP